MQRKNYLSWANRVKRFALFGIGVCASLSVAAQDIATGLKLHYTFDAVSGTTVTDDSGTGNAGTLQGAAAAVTGYTGQGIQCTAKADYIGAPANINVGMPSFTYATWVKLTSLKNATRFFDWGNGADATNNFLAFIPSYGADDGYMALRYRPASGTAVNVTSTTKCPTGKWVHVAVTYAWNTSTSTGVATIYLNGEAVGTGTGLTYNPSTALGNTANNYFGYSRWTSDTNGFNGIFDDVRVYSRALAAADVIELAGLTELNNQYNALTLGDISALATNLTLPSTLGDQGVTVSWSSSNTSVIDAAGNVTQPAQYSRCVTLTAVLSQTINGVAQTKTKTFLATVKGLVDLPQHICQWTFDAASIVQSGDMVQVKDKTDAALTGTLKNNAIIRTIGNTTQYNVLDLGNGTGYFDMGTEIGKAVYALKNYTVMGYFRVDADYAELASNGNYLYAFSNTTQYETNATGYVAGRLSNTGHQCTKYNADNGKMELATGSVVAKGAWHHFAYVQDGTTGKLFIDGTLRKQGTMSQLPAVDIALSARTGTLYNWLGRSMGPTSDVYLRKTLIYDFNVYSTALTATDLTSTHAVTQTVTSLNNAYTENPDYKAPGLQAEFDNLTLGDVSAVKTDMTLPTQGATYPEVTIEWATSKSEILTAAGIVTRPSYFDYTVTLTATLKAGIQSMSKTFTVTVAAQDGTTFANDLLVRFDFSNLNGKTVTDVAEKQFPGTLASAADIHTIGNTQTGVYNVLDLGTTTGYFDMGTEVGKVMCRLNDFTISAFFRVNDSYTALASAGNFLWNFSNTNNALVGQNGYVIGSLTNQSVSITPGYYTEASGNQSVALGQQALKGNWHHMAYTQSGSTGTLYIDGIAMLTSKITNTPSSSLIKTGKMGTTYNWIGRSCYSGDVYLRNAMVYDFRLYKKALTAKEVLTTELKVPETLYNLEAAYKAYVADTKTAETQINAATHNAKASVLDLYDNSNNINSTALGNINKLTFADANMLMNLNNGLTSTFAVDAVKKMVFAAGTTPIDRVSDNRTPGVYPNPASDFIRLTTLDTDDNTVAVYSVAGQLVAKQTLASALDKVDISSLPHGVYIVKNGKYAAKFSKK